MEPLSEWSSLQSQPTPTSNLLADVSKHRSENGATFGSLLGRRNPHQAGGPVWNHSPSGPGRFANHSNVPSLSGRFETPFGERCHFRIAVRSGQSAPSRRPSVEPLSEWSRTIPMPSLSGRHRSENGATMRSENTVRKTVPQWISFPTSRWECPSSKLCFAHVSKTPFGERCHFRITARTAQSSPSRRPSVEPLSEWSSLQSKPTPTLNLLADVSKHRSENGATFGSLLGRRNPHQAGGPVWNHSPSGPE